MPCLGFDLIEKHANCLLVLEDFCDRMYQENIFVKGSVAGRLEKLDFIFVKQFVPSEQVVSHKRLKNNPHCLIQISTQRATVRSFWKTVDKG